MGAPARLLLPLALLLLGGWDLFRGPNPEVERGNEHFKDGRYEEAIDAYRRAQRVLPDELGVNFDLGAALYQKALRTKAGPARDKLLEAAEGEFARVARSGHPTLGPAAQYNLGNALFQRGKLTEAIDAYKAAIRQDPTNRDARYNLELALRQQKAPPPQGGQGQDPNQQPDQDQPSPQNQQSKQQDPQSGQSPDPKQQQSGQGGQPPPDPQQPKQGGDQPQDRPDQPPKQPGDSSQPQDPGQGQPPPTPPPEPGIPPQPNDARQPDGQSQGKGQEQKPPGKPEPREGDGTSGERTTEELGDAERRLDALERRSKELQVQKHRVRTREQRRGRVVKDW